MKQKLAFAMAMIFALLALAPPNSAGLIQTRADFNPHAVFTGSSDAPYNAVKEFGEFTYSVKIDLYGGAEAVGVAFDLYFDPFVFALTGFESGNLPGMTNSDVELTGNNGIRIKWDALPAQALSGTATAVSVRLRVLEGAGTGLFQPYIIVNQGDLYGFGSDFYDISHSAGLDELDPISIIEPVMLLIQDETILKKEYTVGEAPDITGLKLELYHTSSAEPYIIDGAHASITSPADWNTPEKNKKIYVGYMGLTDYFTASVRYAVPLVTALTLQSLPKTVFEQNEAFTAQGLSVKAQLTDGIDTFSEIISYGATGLSVAAPDLTASGTKTVRVLYGGREISYQITVNAATTPPPLPSNITSGIYLITGDMIGKIPVGTPVSAFISGINENQYIKIYSGTEQISSGVMKTGMLVKLIAGGKEITVKTVYLTGDINGSGTVNITDLLQINNYLLGRQQLSRAQLLAADLNGSGTVNITDLLQLNSFLLGKSSITPR